MRPNPSLALTRPKSGRAAQFNVRLMKKYLNILIGIVCTIAIYSVFLGIVAGLDLDEGSGMALVVMIGSPISIIIGSFLVGKLDKEIEYKFKNAIFRTPGLYFSIVYLLTVLITSYNEPITELIFAVPISTIPIFISYFGYRIAFNFDKK